MKSYDLVVIGGGPAGIVAITTAAAIGKTAALVDNHPELGGAGVNTGTVPSKTLRETALALSGLNTRDLYGVDLSLRREATVSDLLRHERNVKAGFNAFLSKSLEASHTDVYCGSGVFVDANTIRIDEPVAKGDRTCVSGVEPAISGPKILIATGSSPVHPDIFPFGSPEVYDSDTILELDRVPKTLAVVGAGAIGSEYACTFAALGTKVHLFDSRDVLLPYLDAEISKRLEEAMKQNGILFHWNERVESCASRGGDGVTLKLASGVELSADAVLVAAGRKSNTENLNLAAAGVNMGDRGIIPVDEHYLTNVPHIYAAGDVIGFPALASTSAQQARIAIRHAFDVNGQSRTLTLLPTGIYTIPEIGSVGDTEQSLTKKGVDYVIGCGSYAANARGRIIGDSNGFLKLLFRREDLKLLGVHAIGEQATDLVHIGMMAMFSGSTAHVFDEACFNVPTLGALYKFASMDAMKRL